MHNYQSITKFLYSLRNKGSKYGLERMQVLASAQGNPEKKLAAIHVAGTNGKGSVCALLEALYRDNGYKTGLFTSPHLVRLNERIQINRSPISDKDLVTYTQYLTQITETLLTKGTIEEYPSFFEWISAIAFQYFYDQSVDIAIIETGLGGRLDATNILKPKLSIITSIGMDHTDILGNTIEKITFEKAGIIKEQRPALIGNLPPVAQSEIEKIALRKNSPLYAYKDRFTSESPPETNLPGSFQRQNAGLAVYATELLQPLFPIKKTTALNHVQWEGRWQVIPLGNKTLIFDSTHNAEACLQLEENLKKLQAETQKKCTIISGIVGIERAHVIVPLIANYAKSIYFVEIQQPKACATATLKSCLPSAFAGTVHTSALKDLFSKNRCLIGEAEETIVVSGSIYLIGEIMTLIRGEETDPIGQDIVHPQSSGDT